MKKFYTIFGFFCCLIYFTSYISRINLGAVVAEIITAEGISKSSISIVLLMSFISYGSGQLLSGALGDKISPVKLILTGLLVTGICNIFIPLAPNTGAMSVIWFINGLAQAFMWPPLVKLMSGYLDEYRYSHTAANVSASSCVGTIFVYLTAPLFIRLSGWRSVFFFSGAAALLVAGLLKIFLPKILSHLSPVSSKSISSEEDTSTELTVWQLFKKYSLIAICIAIISQGILRDGITTWMPTCITEVFHIEAASSILISVILPIFSVFSVQLFSMLQRTLIKNEVALCAYMFALCVLLIALWSIFYAVSIVVSVILSAIIIAVVHGICHMLTCTVAKRFSNTGHVSLFSGLLNCFTYVGSAASTYGMAKISELFGWQVTIFTWCGVAVLGLLMCLICIPKFSYKRKAYNSIFCGTDFSLKSQREIEL